LRQKCERSRSKNHRKLEKKTLRIEYSVFRNKYCWLACITQFSR
jgi:hypothetical protein